MSDYEGLTESDHFGLYEIPDHWKGLYTRGSPKGPIEVAWNHVSPSQIESFSKCKRSWFFKSILKIPEAQKGHQSLGEAFHLCMEKVPKTGVWPSHEDVSASPEDWAKAEAMSKQALPLLPKEPPDKLFKREQGFRLETYPGGPTMVGYVDLGIPAGVGWPSFAIPANEAIVADYKTLSDFRYIKTPQELADSVQMMTYAKWAIEEWPSGLHGQNDPLPEYVRLLHVYAKTKAPFTSNTIRNQSAIVTPKDIISKWEKTLDIVREMQQVSACTDHEDVEAGGALNGHCEAYGGCHFRDKCGISPVSGIKQLFQIGKKPASQEQTDMSGSAILEKIRAAQEAAKAKAASATTGAVQATVTPAATSSASPGTVENTATVPVTVDNPSNQPASTNVVKGPVSGLLAKIRSLGRGEPALAGQVAASYAKEMGLDGKAYTGSGANGKITANTLGDLMKLASGVVPPDAPPRAQETITRPGDTVVDPTKAIEGGDDEDEDESEPGSTPTGTVSATSSTVGGVGAPNATDVAKKRGRPSREEMAAREAAEKARFESAVALEVQKRLPVGDISEAVEKLRNELIQARSEANAERQIADQRKEDNRKIYAELQALKAGAPVSVSEGLTLYVDCFPTKGDREVTDFFEWIGPICRQVAEANSVGDWRQINYTAKGLLANAIRETIKEHGTPKAMTISTFSGGADIALEVLTPIAKRVIKKL